jgi:3-methyladenine DNA glycosylase/8-oxoguanine DNA glycosylase
MTLRNAVRRAYGFDHRPSRQEILDIALKWRPVRGLATIYLLATSYEPTQQ